MKSFINFYSTYIYLIYTFVAIMFTLVKKILPDVKELTIIFLFYFIFFIIFLKVIFLLANFVTDNLFD